MRDFKNMLPDKDEIYLSASLQLLPHAAAFFFSLRFIKTFFFFFCLLNTLPEILALVEPFHFRFQIVFNSLFNSYKGVYHAIMQSPNQNY